MPPVWTSCRSIGVERYTMFFCGRGQRQNVFSHLKDGPLQKNQCELRCTLYLEYFFTLDSTARQRVPSTLCMSLAAADQLFGSEIQQFTEEERWRVYRRKALGERSVETAFFYFVVLFNSFSGILPPFYLMVGWSRALQQVCLSGLFGRDLDQCIRCCLRFRKWSGKKGCLIARSRWCAENIVNIVHLKRYRFLQVGMF